MVRFQELAHLYRQGLCPGKPLLIILAWVELASSSSPVLLKMGCCFTVLVLQASSCCWLQSFIASTLWNWWFINCQGLAEFIPTTLAACIIHIHSLSQSPSLCLISKVSFLLKYKYVLLFFERLASTNFTCSSGFGFFTSYEKVTWRPNLRKTSSPPW